MNIETYRLLLALARRLSRVASDAEDLVQDTLLAGLHADRSDVGWLCGTLRQQATLTARTAARRRRREQSVIDDAYAIGAPASLSETLQPRGLLQKLPPAARRLATLALHGLNADEIRWILGVSPTAFRQRLTSIRKTLASLPQCAHNDYTSLLADTPPLLGAHPFGLLWRALKAALLGRSGLGTHDNDGHLLVLRGLGAAGLDFLKTPAHTLAPGGNE